MRILAVFLLCWGCGTQERTVPISRVSNRAAAQVREQVESSVLPERGLEIAREIAALRGWTVDASMTCEIAGITRIREAMAADMHDQVPPLVLRDQTRFLESFGWVPPHFNLEDAVLDAFAPEVEGMYSLTWRRILVARTVRLAVVESVLRHELVHAFQDGYFGLRERTRWKPNLGDEIAAIHALSEGEAVCITRQLEDPERRGCLGRDEASTEDGIFDDRALNLPLAIRYGLLAPYADGVRFVKRLLQQGGWSRVDEAWRNGARSTRQLFGNTSGDPPQLDTAAVAPPAADCTADFIDVLGEQGLASILFNGADAKVARRMASLLLADRAAYWRCQNYCFGVWHFRARTPDGARALGATVGQSLGVPTTADCTVTPGGVFNLSTGLHDIVITSVHSCDHQSLQIATSSCNSLADWARLLIRSGSQAAENSK